MVIGWLATAALSIAMAGCSGAGPAAASAVDDTAASAVDDTEVRPAPGGAASGAGAATQPDALDDPTVVSGPTRVTLALSASTSSEDIYSIDVFLTVAEDIGVSGVEVRSIARGDVKIVSAELGPLLGGDIVKGPRYVEPGGLAATVAYSRVGRSSREALAGTVATFVVESPDRTPTGDDFVASVTFTDADFTMQLPLAATLPAE